MIDTDREVFNVIRQYKINTDGQTPTLQEISDRMKIHLTPSAISVALKRLEKAGRARVIRRGHGRAIRIALIGEKVEYTPPEIA